MKNFRNLKYNYQIVCGFFCKKQGHKQNVKEYEGPGSRGRGPSQWLVWVYGAPEVERTICESGGAKSQNDGTHIALLLR